MFSLETIRSMERAAARRSQAMGEVPLVFTGEPTFEDMRRIPNLGDRCPRGWRRIFYEPEHVCQITYMVDSSGFGTQGEPALTANQFLRELQASWKDGTGYAIISSGQFQVVIGLFEKR